MGDSVKRNCTLAAAICISLILTMAGPSLAQNLSFQPRLECGVMYYEFEAEAFSQTVYQIVNKTKSAFKYNDSMLCVSGGGTFFMDRFFLDISGQYAFNGHDSESMAVSMFSIEEVDYVDDQYVFSSQYAGWAIESEAKISRHDIAVSLGYSLTRRLSVFAGYKWAETRFKEDYNGPFTIQDYDTDNSLEDAGYTGCRSWGSSTYHFNYHGPFVGFVQAWDFNDARLLKGMLTANMALAYLEGKVENDNGISYLSVDNINGDPVPDGTPGQIIVSPGRTLNLRNDTKGNALGLAIGIGWRGMTAWEGLVYTVGISAYRYEFDAKEIKDQNMNETAVNFKIGLAYLF